MIFNNFKNVHVFPKFSCFSIFFINFDGFHDFQQFSYLFENHSICEILDFIEICRKIMQIVKNCENYLKASNVLKIVNNWLKL